MAIDKITKIDENFVLEGTHVVVPSGTTAQRPSGPADGYVRYNTTIGSLEFYNATSSNWVSTNLIPTVTTVTGDIYDAFEGNLKIDASNTTDSVDVLFKENGSTIATVESIDASTVPFLVDIPSAVTSAATAGDTISVSLRNQDGTPSSNSISKTVVSAPSGGTINTYTESGETYRSHTFTSSVTGGFVHSTTIVVDALLVAGGGGGAAGGGTNETGGGGGAGGMYTYTDVTFNSSDSPRNITVGAGGTGTFNAQGGDGTDSNIQSDSQVNAVGGGGAGQQEVDGRNGGSGGGSGGIDSGTGAKSGGSGTAGQGNDGGDSTQASGDMGAGGGGKSGAGYTTSIASGSGGGGGQGGAGAANTYKDGTTDYYAGGGGGGQNIAGTANSDGSGNVGGIGGGGRGNTGTSGSGTAGTANTGGGGGGGTASGALGGNGGSGIVIIRYKTAQQSL